ncbi:hypothetical protein VNO78_18084 [Psophocarpus tetragonolobus]|uniref:Uncharacterized protein n=1 Tax=Psophocarpus tetragonolobus TaxID=3891 RepID=A0AAN9SJ61_PSOTE
MAGRSAAVEGSDKRGGVGRRREILSRARCTHEGLLDLASSSGGDGLLERRGVLSGLVGEVGSELAKGEGEVVRDGDGDDDGLGRDDQRVWRCLSHVIY